MRKRIAVLAVVGVGLLGAAGYYVHRQISTLQGQVADLGRELHETRQDLADADARADAAVSAANAAARRADDAEVRAEEAGLVAAEFEERASEAAERAADAERVAATATTEKQAAERASQVAQADSEAAQQRAQEAQAAEAQARADARAARAEADRIRHQREVELNRMQEALNTIVETRRTAIGVVMNLGSDRVEFAFDKAELRPRERELLARISGVLLASADQGFVIQVFGHTDDVGTAEYNLGLSERRAQAVCDYLVASGVSPDIISTRGMGKSMPLVEGTDDASRARNRRVEIAVVDTLIEYRGKH